MRKFFFTLLLAFIGSVWTITEAAVQLPSLCDEWHYVTYYAAGMDIPATPVYYSQHLAADTVIGEHKYRQLRGRVGYRYSSNDDYLGALREGDNADIYYVPTDSTHEYLLYAFNANVGDTLKNLWMGTDMQCTTAIITEISTGRLRTFQAKVHVIVSGHYFEDLWELWTDSVGSATSEGPAGVSVYMLNTPYLACACKDGRKIYVGDANCACDPIRLPSLCDEWHMETYTVVDPDNPNYREYTQRLTTDTIIDGKRYRQLRGTANWPSTYLYDNNYLGALREGNNADIYYVPVGSTHEFLLYAFNVQVGDTLTNLWIGNYVSEPYGYKAKVTGIGTGKFRRIDLHVFGTDDNKDIECGEETYWLDSIGRNTGPVWANPVCYAIDPTPEVICACKEGRKVFARDAKCACDPLRLKSLCDTWNIHGVAFPDGHDHHLMFTQQLTTDTLIAGQRYVRLEQGSAYLGALRETDNARIYFIPAGSTHEYLLYAFHANQGDTFDNVWFGGSPSDFPNGCHVTIREITEQNGRKVFELDVSYTTPYEDIVEWPYSIWIEGVGLQDGPAGSDCPLDCLGDYGQSVLCAYKDGVHVYASAFAEEHGCWYTTDDQIDTIPLYVNDGPGSTTVTPVDPNQVVATLNDNLLTIREQSGEEVTYSLAVTPISHAPARYELPEAQKEVSSGNFRNSVAVQLSEDGSYTLTLSKAGWENDIYGTFDYTASGLQPIAAPDAPARELLRNGQLLIQQGEKIFTLTGVQTK